MFKNSRSCSITVINEEKLFWLLITVIDDRIFFFHLFIIIIDKKIHFHCLFNYWVIYSFFLMGWNEPMKNCKSLLRVVSRRFRASANRIRAEHKHLFVNCLRSTCIYRHTISLTIFLSRDNHFSKNEYTFQRLVLN